MQQEVSVLHVDRYDGQMIYIHNQPAFELGGYLGGGAAGVYVIHRIESNSDSHFCPFDSVYEALNLKSEQVRA